MSHTAVLFPGQGAQSVGMGRAAYEASAAVRDLFDRAQGILGYDLAKVCFEGPADRLETTAISQPALYVCGLAGVELLRSQSPDVLQSCEAAAGLSLGEFTALAFAGVFDFETGLRLVQRRGEAMQAAADVSPSGMVSILGLEVDQVESLCRDARQAGEVLEIANLLCPGNVVISGSKAACQRAVELAPKAGAMKAIPLAVAGAFHTELMRPAVDKLAEALEAAKVEPPKLAVISNVDAQSHSDPQEIRQLLLRQVVSPVRWEESIRELMARGIDSFWEVGPGRVLRGLMKRIDRKAACEGISV